MTNGYEHALAFIWLAAFWGMLTLRPPPAQTVAVRNLEDWEAKWNRPVHPLVLLGIAIFCSSAAATVYFHTGLIAHALLLLAIAAGLYYLAIGNRAVALSFAFMVIFYLLEFTGLFDGLEGSLRELFSTGLSSDEERKFSWARMGCFVTAYHLHRVVVRRL